MSQIIDDLLTFKKTASKAALKHKKGAEIIAALNYVLDPKNIMVGKWGLAYPALISRFIGKCHWRPGRLEKKIVRSLAILEHKMVLTYYTETENLDPDLIFRRIAKHPLVSRARFIDQNLGVENWELPLSKLYDLLCETTWEGKAPCDELKVSREKKGGGKH